MLPAMFALLCFIWVTDRDPATLCCIMGDEILPSKKTGIYKPWNFRIPVMNQFSDVMPKMFIQNPVSRTFSLPWFSMVVLGAKPFLSGMDTSVLTWLSLTPRQLARVSLAGRTFGWSVRSSPFGGLVAKNPNRLTTDIWTPRWAARTSHRLMKMLAPMKCNFNRTMKSVKFARRGEPL